MIVGYDIKCKSCDLDYSVKYGTVSKENSFEVFSCSKCKNFFSLENEQGMKCPDCSGEDIIRYNPNKKENLSYYEKMKKQGKLKDEDYNSLKEYWDTIKDLECPKCGKKELEWIFKNG